MAADIIVAYPPNFEDIVAAFPIAREPGVIFSWGNSIYNPSNADIDGSLKAHEGEHGQQQLRMGILEWWGIYLINEDFRLTQEIPAHHAEYRFYCGTTKNSRHKEHMLEQCARRLAGTLYGNMTSYQTARRLVRFGK